MPVLRTLTVAIRCLFLLAVFLPALGDASVIAAEPSPEATVFFEKEIRPLLIDKCQKCHGEKKQESGLRVDSLAALLKGGTSGPAIVPGKADQGTLMSAVRHKGDLQMPPGGKLKDEQVAALAKWVTTGAVWPNEKAVVAATPRKGNHWSFQPVANPPLPNVRDAKWAATPLDRFTLAQLEAKGLKPVGLADKRTLLRRVTFDLTGLPPTPEEIDAYLKDQSPDAYDKMIDRLLASKAYGERWGRHWLDVARYADTAGDGADYPVREAGKYRDWVVNAFNADQPYDQFLRDQIAGDILGKTDNSTRYAERVTATGFLAIGKRYGYAANADYQYLDFADVIDSVGRSLLGLSIGCARCHDHKYDPVTAADYYALYGIFQSTKWAFPGGEEMKRPTHFPPLVPPEEAARREKAKTAELAALDAEIGRLKSEKASLDGKTFAGGVDLAFEGQPIGKPPSTPWLSAGPNAVIAAAQSPFNHIHPAGTRGVRVGSGQSIDGVRYVFENGLRASPGKQMHFTIDFRTVAPASKTGAYRFYLGRGVIESLAVQFSVTATEFAIRDGDKWEVVRKLTPGDWQTLQITLDPATKKYSGVVGKPGDLTAFKDKALNPAWDGVANTFICDAIGHVAGQAPERDLDNIGLQEAPFAAPGSPSVAAPAPKPDQKDRLAKLDADLAATTKLREAKAAADAYEVAYGVSEGTPVNARIQKRGEPDKLGAEVPRRFLEILGGDVLPASEKGSGRLELANWITRPTNPLTARVFVNRVWGWHFGRGLVSTPSDFGVRGEAPSHPELLDWLTTRFIESGWSVKALHKLILRSRTYQLASDDDQSNLNLDPTNIWLWRHSRQALDAESIRDAMLAVSGRLDRSPPTPHPFPPVGTWGFTIHNPFHAVYDSDRRSIYLMVQRNRRHPFLAMFDAPDPNLSAAERLPTTTPTQTLYLMNSPFVHTQSEAFAKRLLATPGDDAARVRLAFESAHGKSASEAEVNDSLTFVANYRKKLGERGLPADQQSTVAWAALGRVMLTGNAFLYVD
ncbi:PSD1 and planctomycete cytochrome C domain-containing protein [Zavarzinella formosa]|uniref:PSD1 and planctomycete cytochrome C domain-containing protein n=1 Tax=Zavarzinella formosa TaxID=360055 RepID=UPI00036E3E58|nr:PSD1 and planctomycete cytochrome C domain-containing protein [Zavarzinella formosa]